MSSLPTRFCKIASLKCKPKWDFLSKLRKDKKKGKQVVFPYENASFASIFYPFLPRLCHSKTTADTAQSSLLFIIFPNQTAAKKQAILVCFFFLLFASRCILIFYSIDLISSNPNSTSNLRHRIFFTL